MGANPSMVFVATMLDMENGGAEVKVLIMPSDYARTSRWESEYEAAAGVELTAIEKNYAAVWHALKRKGRLSEVGAPDELDLDAIYAMGDRFSAPDIDDIEDGALPLALELYR